MTRKKKASGDSQEIFRAGGEADKSEARDFAEMRLSAVALNTITAERFSRGTFGEADMAESVNVMFDKVENSKGGDTSELESTLIAQMVSLNAIYNELARRAALNMGEYLHVAETYLRLALKAQSQCMRTIQVLSALKNPPLVYAKQANISNGPQQINNGIPAHVGETSNQSNELSGGGNELLPDTRASQVTIRANQEMEAMGAINGAAD